MLILLYNEYEELRMDKIICTQVFHFNRILPMTIISIVCDIMKLKLFTILITIYIPSNFHAIVLTCYSPNLALVSTSKRTFNNFRQTYWKWNIICIDKDSILKPEKPVTNKQYDRV